MKPATSWRGTSEQNQDEEVDRADDDGDHRRHKHGHCHN